MFTQLIIISLLSNQVKSDENNCLEKFHNEMEYNLNEVNMTLKELKNHIILASYYDFTAFKKNNKLNLNLLNEFKYICEIDYSKINYDELKRIINISKSSKKHFDNLVQLNMNIDNVVHNIKNIVIFLLISYLFIHYPFTFIFYIIYYITLHNNI